MKRKFDRDDKLVLGASIAFTLASAMAATVYPAAVRFWTVLSLCLVGAVCLIRLWEE